MSAGGRLECWWVYEFTILTIVITDLLIFTRGLLAASYRAELKYAES